MSFPSAAAALAALLQAAAPDAATGVAPRETIVVTAVASRVEEAIDATPATVSVITREALQQGLARDIRDALRHEPGISVEHSPARFGLGNIAIRGLEGNRVQLLLDGIRMPEGFRIGSFSNAARNPYDLALLSRIEVLRGPASALYGSDALAGVVSMTTLDPRDLLRSGARAGGFAEAGYAEADRGLTTTGAVAARAGPFALLAAATRAEGEERANRGDVGGVGAARTQPNPQETEGDARLAKAVLALAGGGRLRAIYDRFERRVATDVLSLNPQSPRTVRLAGDDRAARRRYSLDGVHFAVGPLDRVEWTVHSQRSATAQETEEVRANTTAQCLSAAGSVTCRREARFTLDQSQHGVTVIGQAAAGAHALVAGAEWSRGRAEEMRDGRQTNLATGAVTNVVGTDVFPTRDFPVSRTERVGAFVQDEIAMGAVRLVPALRYDRFEMRPLPDAIYTAANPGRTPVALSDAAWSPKVGVLWPLSEHAQLTLQAATGFRAPPSYDANVGLSNLPLGFTVIPNPDLEPERSRGLEIGVRGRFARFDYALTAYRTDYTDLIVSRAPLPCPGDPRCVPGAAITFQSQNVASARIEGMEARARVRLGLGWTAKLGAAWSRGEDRARGVPLNAIDPAKVVASLAWDGRGGGAQVHVTHAAAKSRIDASPGALFATPAFTVVDLSAHMALARRVTLHAGVFNLGDRKHWLWSDVRGVLNPGVSVDRYSQPGRTASLQVRAAF